MSQVEFACADCLEEAGGRQQRHHNVTWHLDICPCCNKKAIVTTPESFGNPQLEPQALSLSERESA